VRRCSMRPRMPEVTGYSCILVLLFRQSRAFSTCTSLTHANMARSQRTAAPFPRDRGLGVQMTRLIALAKDDSRR
jgi:hypothetical protein